MSDTFADTPAFTSISFNDIPDTIRTPMVAVEFDSSDAVSGAALQPFKNLIIGQRLAAGTVPELVPQRITNADIAAVMFGAGSMLHAMAEAHFDNNKTTETWIIALDDDGAAAAAAGALAFGGAISVAGTVFLMIGDIAIRVGVTNSDTLQTTATKTIAAINAKPECMVTAAINGVDDTKVDLTAVHKGEVFNALEIHVNYYTGDALPIGLTLAVTAMSGGTANPDASLIWAALGDEQFNVLAFPYTDTANLIALEEELGNRWGPLQMNEGAAITSANLTHSALGTLGDSRNSKHVTIMHCYKMPTPGFRFAAGVAASASFNGNIDPARPFQTLAIKGILPAKVETRFTREENNLLLWDGISTHIVDSGGVVRIQRLITTYKLSDNGAEDISYLDLNTIFTLSYLRYDFRNYIQRKYPRHKLAGDSISVGSGQVVMTPKLGRAEAIARFKVWEQLGLVEDIEHFKKDLICGINPTDPNRLDWRLAPNLVNQFRVGGVQIRFIL